VCCIRRIIDTLITNLRRGTETTVLAAVISDYRISLSVVLGECEPSRIWISDAGRVRGSDIDTVKHQTILTKRLTRQSKDRDNRFNDISIRKFSVEPIVLSFSFIAFDGAGNYARLIHSHVNASNASRCDVKAYRYRDFMSFSFRRVNIKDLEVEKCAEETRIRISNVLSVAYKLYFHFSSTI